VDKWIDSVVLTLLESMMVEPNGFEMNLEEPLPAAERMCRTYPTSHTAPQPSGTDNVARAAGLGLLCWNHVWGGWNLDCGVGLMVLDVVTTEAPSDDAIGILHVRIAEASGLKAKSMFFTLGMHNAACATRGQAVVWAKACMISWFEPSHLINC
jgi:hypothetical protein